MRETSYTVKTCPGLLSWARDRVGVEQDSISSKVGVTNSTYSKWENGENEIPFYLIEKLCRILRLHFADFYRESLPITPPRPKDCRKYANTPETPFSYKTHVYLLDAQTRQYCYDYLLTQLNRKNTFNKLNNPLTIASSNSGLLLRTYLALTAKEQTDNGDSLFFQILKNKIEFKGIMVIQVPLSLDFIRGMALYHETAPMIIVNSEDSFAVRCFSLFHELAHLLLNVSAISGRYGLDSFLEDSSDQLYQIERFCNYSAASALMPRELIENTLDSLGMEFSKIDNYIRSGRIFNLAVSLNVSKSSLLYRLLELDLGSETVLKSKLQDFADVSSDTDFVTKKSKRKNGGPSYYSVKRNQYGRLYIRTAIDAFNSGNISNSEVCSILSIKLKNIENLESEISN